MDTPDDTTPDGFELATPASLQSILNPQSADPTEDQIRSAASASGLDPDDELAIAKIESGDKLDPNARNGTSRGIFQMQDDTGNDYYAPGEDRSDPTNQIRAGVRYDADSAKSLKATLGRDPTGPEIYAAHLLGRGGAHALLTADDDEPFADVAGRVYGAKATSVMLGNGIDPNATVGEVKQMLQGWVDEKRGRGSKPDGYQFATPSDLANIPAVHDPDVPDGFQVATQTDLDNINKFSNVTSGSSTRTIAPSTEPIGDQPPDFGETQEEAGQHAQQQVNDRSQDPSLAQQTANAPLHVVPNYTQPSPLAPPAGPAPSGDMFKGLAENIAASFPEMGANIIGGTAHVIGDVIQQGNQLIKDIQGMAGSAQAIATAPVGTQFVPYTQGTGSDALQAAGEAVSDVGTEVRARNKEAADWLTPDTLKNQTSVAGKVGEAVQTLGRNVVPLAEGFASPELAFGALPALTKYSEAREAGEEPGTAAAAAITEGTVGAATSRLTFATALAHDIPLIPRLAETWGTLATQNVAQEAADIATERHIEGKDVSDQEVADRIEQAIKGSVAPSLFLGAAGHAYRAAMRTDAERIAADLKRYAKDLPKQPETDTAAVAPDSTVQPLPEYTADELVARAKQAIATHETSDDPDHQSMVGELRDNLDNPQALADMAGVKLKETPNAQPAGSEAVPEQDGGQGVPREGEAAVATGEGGGEVARRAAGEAEASAPVKGELEPTPEDEHVYPDEEVQGLEEDFAPRDDTRYSRDVKSDPGFARFFADSKVTNEDGSPKLVHHGTSEGFNIFDKNLLGTSTGHMTAPLGHFLTESLPEAKKYAEKAANGVPADERVITGYASIRNPAYMTKDQFLAIDSQDEARQLRQQLQAQGHDGIRLDMGNGKTQWVAFDSGQIKDINNRGTWNRENPDIRFSQDDGSTERPVTKAEAEDQLKKELGNTWFRRWQKSGGKLVHSSEVGLDGQTHVKGFTTADNVPHVVYDHLPLDRLAKTAIHETVHANIRRIIGDIGIKQLANAIRLKNPGLLGRLPHDVNPEHMDEEVVAHALEETSTRGRNNVLDKIKVSLNRLGVPMRWLNANEAILAQAAHANLRDYARNGGRGTLTVGGTINDEARFRRDERKTASNDAGRGGARKAGVARPWNEKPVVRGTRYSRDTPEVRVKAQPRTQAERDAITKDILRGKEGSPIIHDMPTPAEEGLSGVNRVQLAAERAQRGLEPLDVEGRRDMPQAWEAALIRHQQDPGYGQRVAADIATKSRPATVEETAALVQHGAYLRNQLDIATDEIDRARKAGDPTAQRQALAWMKEINELLEVHNRAAKNSGYEWSLSGKMRQMLSDRDYSMVSQMQRLKAIYDDGRVPPAVQRQVKEHVDAIAALQKELSARMAKVSEEAMNAIPGARAKILAANRRAAARAAMLKDAFADPNRMVEVPTKRMPPPRPEPSPTNKKQRIIHDRYKNILKRLASVTKHPIPEGAGVLYARDSTHALIRDLAKLHVEAGVSDPHTLLDLIHTDVGEMTGLGHNEIGKIIAGISRDVRPTRAQHESTLAQIKKELRKMEGIARSPEEVQASRDRARNKAAMTGAMKQLAELERMLETGNLERAKRPPTAPFSAEVETLRRQVEAKRAEVEDLRKLSEPSPEEKARVRRIVALKQQLAETQDRINRGDYSKPTKVRTTPAWREDETVKNLQYQLAREKHKLDNLRKNEELKQQGPIAKGADFIVKAHRFGILTSINTIGKLEAAAAARLVLTPAHELAGSGLRHLPILSKIAAKAAREGQGFDLGAELAALKGTWNWQRQKQVWRHGSDDLDERWGTKADYVPSWADIPGHFHYFLKEPAKLNEYHRSLVLRSNHEMNRVYSALKAEGRSDADAQRMATDHMQKQSVIDTLQSKAIGDAMRAILQGDNAAHNWWKGNVESLRRKGMAGAWLAKGGDFMFPITRVPFNFLTEMVQHGAGGLIATAKVTQAMREGRRAYDPGVWKDMTFGQRLQAAVDRMDPEVADYIMRNAKKQVVGAILALGYFLGPNVFGGLGMPGDWRKHKRTFGQYLLGHEGGTPAKKETKVGNYVLPSSTSDNPALMMLQAGAHIRRLHDEEKMSGPQAAGETALKVFEELPFFDTPMRLINDVRYNGARAAGMGLVRSTVEPALVQNVAGLLDPNPGFRHPQNWKQDLEVGIPLMREDVPMQGPSKRHH